MKLLDPQEFMDPHLKNKVYIWDVNWQTPWWFTKGVVNVVKCNTTHIKTNRKKEIDSDTSPSLNLFLDLLRVCIYESDIYRF